MKNIKKFTLIVLFVCALLVCGSCKKCNPEKEIVVPEITKPNEVFLQVENFKINNDEAYRQLLNSYGAELLLNMVDDALLPAVQDEEGFKEYLDEVIYQDDEEKTEETRQKFFDQLPLSGLSTNSSDANYYETYYRLMYRRLEAAKADFKEYIAELDEEAKKNDEDPYYTEDEIKSAFESSYRKKNDLIIVAFDSNNNANDYLVQNDIDLNYLNTGWQKTDGTKLTDEEILAIFEKIYQDVNNVTESGIKTYSYDDLVKINASLASLVYNYQVKQYTKTPVNYGSYAFIVYKNGESANLDKDGNPISLDDTGVKDQVIEDLIEAEVSTAYSTMVAQKNQLLHSLKIYDKGLENLYRLTYNNAYSNLGYAADAYPTFTKNNEESSTVLFSYKDNSGKVVEVTPDQIFEQLKLYYGDYLTSLYMKQYFVLKDNEVYDIVSNKILNQDKYDEYYESDVEEYKEAFENGTYENMGYPASYGWNNFLRDYLGLLSEEKVIINLDSSLYNDCLDEYKESLFLGEEVKDEDGKVITAVDQKIQDKMDEIIEKYFNVTAIAMSAYYDKDFDNVPDELEAGSEEALLAEKLLKVVYSKVVEKKKAIATAFTEILLEYNVTNKTSDTIWKEFKAAGLKLKTISSTTYTAQTDKDEIILNQLRTQGNRLIDFNNDEEKGKDLCSVTSPTDLSDKHIYTKNSQNYTVRATDFVFANDEASDVIVVDDTAQLYFVTKCSKAPTYSITKDGSTVTEKKPTYQNYHVYTIKTSDVASDLARCITGYYIPAINALIDNNGVNNALVDDSIAIVDQITYANKESLKVYLNACKIENETDK